MTDGFRWLLNKSNEKEMIHGTKNAWEYYFEQPSSYQLDEVYKSKHLVILSKMEYLSEVMPSFLETEQEITYFHNVCMKYLRFNQITLKEIYTTKKRLFGNKRNILGVLYRGTDYTRLKPQAHSIIAPIDEYITRTKTCFDEWKMDWIYLETEEAEVVNIFREHFKERLIVSASKRIEKYTADMGFTPTIGFKREHDNYLKGLEYIIDTVLLSECDAIIAPKVNGSMAALELNGNKYRYKYIYSLGVNP